MPIFQWESKFWVYKCDKGHLEGPGEQWEWQPQGPGQGVVHFFKNVYDTRLHANFSMGIQILRSQGWKIPYRGSRWTMRMNIWKKELLPVLVPGVAVLIIHLDPQHGFCHPCNLKIRILHEKLAYKHVSHACVKNWITPCPGPWGRHSLCSPGPSIFLLSPL